MTKKPRVSIENLEQWMKDTIPVTEFNNLQRDIPHKLGIGEKTWYNYRYMRTRIPADVLFSLMEIFEQAGYPVQIMVSPNKKVEK